MDAGSATTQDITTNMKLSDICRIGPCRSRTPGRTAGAFVFGDAS